MRKNEPKYAQCYGNHHSLDSQCQVIKEYKDQLKEDVEDAIQKGFPGRRKRSVNGRIRYKYDPFYVPYFPPYNRGSNTAVFSIEYDNITPTLRGFTADIRCPCMAVILPLLKRLNTA
ncbi:unnamed protein product [Rotaria magnacalcarata]